jgi:Pyruvate/2-oxoacid:ferredoxin oxidoreductase gamma subunit
VACGDQQKREYDAVHESGCTTKRRAMRNSIRDQATMTETSLEKAKLKFEQARARLKALEARQSTEERKRDTRRKVILGGALLELAKTDKEASALVARLIASLTRDNDKKVFEKTADAPVETPPALLAEKVDQPMPVA